MKNIEKSAGECTCIFTSYVQHFFVLYMNSDRFNCINFIQLFIHVLGTRVLCSKFLSSQNCQNMVGSGLAVVF